MSNIRLLTSKDTLAGSDNFPIYDSANGDDRKASLTTLLAWIEDNFADPDFPASITAPTSSGFNIQLAAVTTNLFVILNPTGAFAAGTITLPPVADCFDGQEIIVVTSQTIGAFTLAGNGATLVGAPSALAATGSFRIRFNELQSIWYCIGQNLAGVTIGGVQSLSGAGAVNITQGVTAFTSTATGNALTLADGAQGQGKTIVYTAEAAGADTGILTPSNLGGGTTITFNAVGDACQLVFISTDWWPVSLKGAVLA